MEWILSKDKLECSALATIIVKPVRLAFIIPEDDPAIAERAIVACCLTWGGEHNVLIPYSQTGFSQTWWKVLCKLDPDQVVDCSGLSDADKQRFVARRQYVHTWDRPSETLLVVGALQYSALDAIGKYLKTNKDHVVVQPTFNSPSDRRRLSLLARYGLVDENHVEATLKQHHGLDVPINYSEFANVRGLDLSSQRLRDVFLGMAKYATPEPLTRHNPIDLTL